MSEKDPLWALLSSHYADACNPTKSKGDHSLRTSSKRVGEGGRGTKIHLNSGYADLCVQNVPQRPISIRQAASSGFSGGRISFLNVAISRYSTP